MGTGSQTLYQWQTNADGSDRHAIMVAPGAGFIWETWLTTIGGHELGGVQWREIQPEHQRAAAGGLDLGRRGGFPDVSGAGALRRGRARHGGACVPAGRGKRSRYNNYLYPATHYAAPSSNTNANLPSMGQRLRLKSSFAVPSGWTKEEKAVLAGLKKYGAMVADNGNYFSISVTPDDRWPSNCFNDLTSISATNFEVIQTTGPNEGPRSPGAPVANAGPDQTVPVGVPVILPGVVTYSNTPPMIQWKQYSGPGMVTFGNPAQTNTTATFSAPGIYTLELSAADGVHAVACNAAVYTVASTVNVSMIVSGTNVNLSWTGGTAPFVVQEAGALPAGSWSTVVTTNAQSVSLPMTNAAEFFRVQGQ